MFALPFIRRRAKGGTGSIPPGTYATLQDVADAISQLIGGAPDVTLDTIAEIAARIIQDESSLAAVSAAIANKQDRNAKLTALSALALTADKLIYATGANTLAATDLTAFMRSVLAAQDAAGARAAIGAVAQQDYNTDKTATTAAIAGRQAASPVLDSLAGGYTAGANQVAAPGASVPAFTWAAGTGYTFAPITFSAFGKNVATRANPAANSMLITSDAVGGVTNIATGTLGRPVLSMDLVANLAGFFQIPAFGDSGFPGARRIHVSWITGLSTAPTAGGQIPYSTSTTGMAFTSTSGLGFSWLNVASPQAARALIKNKASIAANFNNNTPVPTNGTPVELLWTSIAATPEGFDAADVSLTGNPGRVTTVQASSLAIRPKLSLLASGPGDFFVTLELRDATGATVGNENGAPGAGTGAGWKTRNVPFRIVAAGYWSVDLPEVPLKAGGNFAQLRVYLTRPVDATAVSVSEYQLNLVQQA